jgi:FHS family L-fucose permease-like MFS transporter
MRKLGYKAGFVTGLVLYGTGALLFWPAAIVGRYSFFLLALFVIASGLSFLETASNPFVAKCGDAETSERRLNFSQAFNPFGSITGVLLGTTFIFSGVELSSQQISSMQTAGTLHAYLQQELVRVIRPYVALAVVVLAWAVLIAVSKFPPIRGEYLSKAQEHGRIRDLFRYRHFVLAVLAQFFYVGAQVGTWSYFIQYAQEYTHRPEKVAGYLLTGTLVAFGIGRFASFYFMKFVAPNRLMGAYSLINVVLVFIGVAFRGWPGLWALFLTSFFMSLMFPTIFALGLKGLGVNTKVGGSLLVMSIIGGALLTPLMGLISQRLDLASAYAVPLVAYVVVAYYAFWGSRMREVI